MQHLITHGTDTSRSPKREKFKHDVDTKYIVYSSTFLTFRNTGDEFLVLCFINENVGHGIFAGKSYDQHEFIGLYSGYIELGKEQDYDNAFVLKTLIPEFVIDASKYRNLASFINHSNNPNAVSYSFFYRGTEA